MVINLFIYSTKIPSILFILSQILNFYCSNPKLLFFFSITSLSQIKHPREFQSFCGDAIDRSSGRGVGERGGATHRSRRLKWGSGFCVF